MARFVAGVVAASVLLAGSAQAQTQAAEADNPRSAVYAIVGLATPVGVGGFEGVHRFGSMLELSVGLGAGLTALLAHSGSPLQWSVMPRLRAVPSGRHSFVFGAGVSGGNIGDVPLVCDEFCDEQRTSYPVHYHLWANVEIGGEHWERNFAFRYFVGWASGCRVDSCTVFGLPYIGMGAGIAF